MQRRCEYPPGQSALLHISVSQDMEEQHTEKLKYKKNNNKKHAQTHKEKIMAMWFVVDSFTIEKESKISFIEDDYVKVTRQACFGMLTSRSTLSVRATGSSPSPGTVVHVLGPGNGYFVLCTEIEQILSLSFSVGHRPNILRKSFALSGH